MIAGSGKRGGGGADRAAGSDELATTPARPGARDIPLQQTITSDAQVSWAEPEAPDPAAPLAPEELPPMDAGSYVIGPEVARGGMGRVVRAVDRRLGRVVALKQLIDDNPRRRIRFAREAQITARLQHPSIVPVYEVGPWPGGGLAYSMKLVSGRPLDAAIEATRTLAERIALLPRLIDVIDAVAYAHSQRVVHRDIKPSNIILGDFGESILIDWGVAKLLDHPTPDPDPARSRSRVGTSSPPRSPPTDSELSDPDPDPLSDIDPPDLLPSDLTVPGSVVGTPAYMAPEQAGGEPIDERADVYALGTMLYHLLCGRLPYRGHGTEVVAQLIAGAPPPLETVEPHVPAELAAIVTRAMDREPSRRYSAAELAAELRRFTTGQLVAAHRYSARERIGRWARRHRAAVVVGAVALAIVAAVAVVSAIRIVRERDQARSARRDAIRRVDELTVEKAQVEVGRDSRGALQLLAGLSPGSAMWPAARLIAAAALESGIPRQLGIEPLVVNRFRFLEDGSLLAASPGGLAIWDPTSGERRAITVERVLGIGYHGRHALAVRSGQVLVVALPSGAVTALGPAPAGLRLGAVAADGTLAAIATAETTYLWSPGGEPRPLGPAPSGEVLEFSPTGDYLLAYTTMDLPDRPQVPEGIGLGVGIWRLPDGEWRQVSGFDFVDQSFHTLSPDGEKLGSLSPHKNLYILGPRTGSFSSYMLPGMGQKLATVTVAAFSPDSKLYSMGDSQNNIRLVGPGVPTQIVGRRDGEITRVAWLPDSSGLLASSRDATVTLFRLRWGYYQSFVFPRPIVDLAVAPDGNSIAALLDDGAVHAMALPVDDEQRMPAPAALAAVPGDDRVLFVPAAAPTEVRALLHGLESTVGRCPKPIDALVAAPGTAAALCGGAVTVWRGGVARPLGGASVGAVAVSRDGRILTWSQDGALRLHRGDDPPRPVATVEPAGRIFAIAGGGSHAVAASGEDLVWIDLGTGAVRRQPAGRDEIAGLAISDDGTLVAAGRRDNAIAIHDRTGGEPRLLRRHSVPPSLLAFSRDGANLLSGSMDSETRYWDVASGVSHRVSGHSGPILAVGFGADRAFRTVDAAVVRRWSDDLPRDEPGLRRWIDRALSRAPEARATPPAPVR